MEFRWTSGPLKETHPLQRLPLPTPFILSKSPSPRSPRLTLLFQLHQMSQKFSTAPCSQPGMRTLRPAPLPCTQPDACGTCCTCCVEASSLLRAPSLQQRKHNQRLKVTYGVSDRSLIYLRQKMMSVWLQSFCELGVITIWLSSCVTGCLVRHALPGMSRLKNSGTERTISSHLHSCCTCPGWISFTAGFVSFREIPTACTAAVVEQVVIA